MTTEGTIEDLIRTLGYFTDRFHDANPYVWEEVMTRALEENPSAVLCLQEALRVLLEEQKQGGGADG